MTAWIAFAVVSLLTWGVGFFLFLRAYGDKRRALARLRELGADDVPAAGAAPAATKWITQGLPVLKALLLPRAEDLKGKLQDELVKAGIFHGQARRIFRGVKRLLALVLPIPCAAVPYALRALSGPYALAAAVSAVALGLWLPHLWLRGRVAKRQRLLRGALPDALDMLVLCLEGGVALMAAIQRVTDELEAVHPALGAEMNVLQREIELGLSPGQALKKFGQRCGLEEVRDLACTILQSEQYGASVAKAFRGYAETYRLERQQRAEELAQKAAVKILFPTLLCIFPAIFIVLLGPAAFQIASIFAR